MRHAGHGPRPAGRDQGAAADGVGRPGHIPAPEAGPVPDGLDRRRAAVTAGIPHGPPPEVSGLSEFNEDVRNVIHKEKAFSGFSVKDLDSAKRFYGEVLGVEVEAIPAGLQLKIGNGILVYPKEDHEPATYTMLNFPVEDIYVAVADL